MKKAASKTTASVTSPVADTQLKPVECRRLQVLTAQTSNYALAELIGVAPRTLQTLSSGMKGHRGTVLQVRRYLAALDPSEVR